MLAGKIPRVDAFHQLTSGVVGSDQVMIHQLTRGCGYSRQIHLKQWANLVVFLK